MTAKRGLASAFNSQSAKLAFADAGAKAVKNIAHTIETTNTFVEAFLNMFPPLQDVASNKAKLPFFLL
ncbi:MAG: hypothetical protein WEC37_02700 [Anaerolineales bacterium]